MAGMQGDRVLQFASISFDAAVEEIFGAICHGATLVLRTETCLASSRVFSQFCAEQRITVLDLPTAFWHHWVQECDPTTIPTSLRQLIIGGERVLPAIVEQWQHLTQSHSVSLWNTYGPTEATVVATTYEISAQPQRLADQEIPIGQPLPNVDIYVLNSQGLPVPQGAMGELHLGGVGARSGLSQPTRQNRCTVYRPSV